MNNWSYSVVYTLMEPKELLTYRFTYFTGVLLLYLLIMFLNSSLCTVIVMVKTLHKPMYIFVFNLCANGIFGAIGFYPKFMHDLYFDSYVISSYMCALQSFVIYSALMCEYTTLTVIAYDRYIAICRPLDYHSILTKYTCGKLILFSWMLPTITMIIALILSNQQPVCGSHIEKLYCDNWSIVKLSCQSNVPNNIFGFIAILLHLCLVIFVIVSYVKLIGACRASLESRKKFWQTCVPHMLSLINSMVASLFDTMYSRYGANDVPESLRIFFSLEMIVVPPLFNPFIYGLKLTEIRQRLLQCFVKAKPSK
ncbi:olfactory receptor 52E8-like [Brachyhypopomus gauderio]|uniref:olfactory receptor 52E8-like n=1 Tax=Brachyhypopomus gauderio TaxID=698409 RepID=UPI004043702D